MKTYLCQDCAYIAEHPNSSEAMRCHRNSPQTSELGAGTVWPTVLPDDWCGDFKRRYQGAIKGPKETSQCTSS